MFRILFSVLFVGKKAKLLFRVYYISKYRENKYQITPGLPNKVIILSVLHFICILLVYTFPRRLQAREALGDQLFIGEHPGYPSAASSSPRRSEAIY